MKIEWTFCKEASETGFWTKSHPDVTDVLLGAAGRNQRGHKDKKEKEKVKVLNYCSNIQKSRPSVLQAQSSWVVGLYRLTLNPPNLH